MMSKAVLKVKRSEDAKKFPLISTAKAGDVGYDLHAVFPYKDEFQDYGYRMTHIEHWYENMGVDYEQLERDMRQSIVIPAGGRGVIPTGIFLELPEDYWASIEARSSTSKKMMICPKGVIDEGYRGELFAVLLNVGNEPQEIFHGDRYVQLILHKRNSADIMIREVDELSGSERGDSGFGSTGQSTK
jgi:dUTP pyrophosphatase